MKCLIHCEICDSPSAATEDEYLLRCRTMLLGK